MQTSLSRDSGLFLNNICHLEQSRIRVLEAQLQEKIHMWFAVRRHFINHYLLPGSIRPFDYSY